MPATSRAIRMCIWLGKTKSMTLEEAQKIADIISTADDGCHSCVSNLAEHLTEEFPGFAWIVPPPDEWYKAGVRRVESVVAMSIGNMPRES